MAQSAARRGKTAAARTVRKTKKAKRVTRRAGSPLAGARMMGFVPIKDGARTRDFYEGVLGLRFIEDDGFAMVFQSGSVPIRAVRMGNEFTANPYTILGWQVKNIRAAVRALSARGVTFEHYASMQQDDSGIWASPGGKALVAWFKDPAGNVLSVSQH